MAVGERWGVPPRNGVLPARAVGLNLAFLATICLLPPRGRFLEGKNTQTVRLNESG